MAETIRIASTSVAELKQAINDLKDAMIGLDRTSEEYQADARAVSEMQEKLAEVMYDSKNSIDVNENSMRALKSQLKEMKAEAQSMDMGSKEFKDMSDKILDVTNKLKDAEAAQGTFGRNVGNYSQGFQEAFSAMGVSINSLNPAFKAATAGATGLNGILNVLKAHPIMAALALLVGVVMKLKEAIDGNEEASQRWTQAMSAFKPILDIIDKALQGISEVLVTIVEWAGKAFSAVMSIIPGYDELQKKEEEIAKLQNEIDIQEREMTTENAKLKREEMALREKASDKENYTAQQRKKFLKEALDLQKKQLQNELAIEQKKLRQLEISASIKKNSKEQNDLLEKQRAKIDEINASLSQAETSYNKQNNRINKEISSQQKQQQQEQKRAFEERKRQIEEEKKKRIEAAKQAAEAQKKAIEDVKKAFELASVNAAKEGEKLINNLKNEYQKVVDDSEKSNRTLRLGLEADILKLFVKMDKMTKRQAEDFTKMLNGGNEAKILNYLKEVLKIVNWLSDEEKEIVRFAAQGTFDLKDVEIFKTKYKQLYDVLEKFKERSDALFVNHSKKVGEISAKDFDAFINSTTKYYKYVADLSKMTSEIMVKNYENGFIQKINGLDKKGGLFARGFFDIEAAKLGLIDFKDATLDVLDTTLNEADETIKTATKSYEGWLQDYQIANSKMLYAISEEDKKAASEAAKKAEQGLRDSIDSLMNKSYRLAESGVEKINQINDTAIKAVKVTDFWKSDEKSRKEMLDELRADYNRQMEVINKYYADEEEQLKAKTEMYGELSSNQQLTDEQRAEAYAKYLDSMMSLDDVYTQHYLELVDAQNDATMKSAEIRKKNISNLVKSSQDMASSMGSLFGTISDIMEDNIKQKVENGKISEEEAEKEFENVKKAQKAAVIVNTLSGAIGAFMQDKAAYPAPYNYIIAGIDLATTLAAGWLQLKQIDSTQFGSSGGSSAGGGVMAQAAATPLLDQSRDVNDLTSLNVNGDSEMKSQKVYITQTDIHNSETQVSVRESQTSF